MLWRKGAGVLSRAKCGVRQIPRSAGRRAGYDVRPPFCGGSEDAGIADQVRFGSRHKRRQFFQQFQRSQNDVGGSISPRPLEAIEQAVAGERLQTLGGNGWPGTIAAQSLKSAPVCGRNGSVRMQAEARDAGAARAGEGVHALGIDLIPDTRDTAPGIGTKSHFARYLLRPVAKAPIGAKDRSRVYSPDFLEMGNTPSGPDFPFRDQLV